MNPWTRASAMSFNHPVLQQAYVKQLGWWIQFIYLLWNSVSPFQFTSQGTCRSGSGYQCCLALCLTYYAAISTWLRLPALGEVPGGKQGLSHRLPAFEFWSLPGSIYPLPIKVSSLRKEPTCLNSWAFSPSCNTTEAVSTFLKWFLRQVHAT